MKGVINLSVSAFSQLYNTNYYVNVTGCLFQTWKARNRFSCTDVPRKMNLLLYLKGCKATFRMIDGKVYYAYDGDTVYMPKDAQYTLEISDRKNESSGTFGANFLLYDEKGRDFVASNEPLIFRVPSNACIYDLFSKMSKISDAGLTSISRLKCLFYDIVSILCETQEYKKITKNEFKIIEKGISYLETDYKLEKSVSDIAAMCSVSENYFRRLFKEYSGISPKEYILRAKIDKAKLRLYEENIPISEIADICGFPDTAYFCRLFKKRTGVSPLSYRKLKKYINQGG